MMLYIVPIDSIRFAILFYQLLSSKGSLYFKQTNCSPRSHALGSTAMISESEHQNQLRGVLK